MHFTISSTKTSETFKPNYTRAQIAGLVVGWVGIALSITAIAIGIVGLASPQAASFGHDFALHQGTTGMALLLTYGIVGLILSSLLIHNSRKKEITITVTQNLATSTGTPISSTPTPAITPSMPSLLPSSAGLPPAPVIAASIPNAGGTVATHGSRTAEANVRLGHGRVRVAPAPVDD